MHLLTFLLVLVLVITIILDRVPNGEHKLALWVFSPSNPLAALCNNPSQLKKIRAYVIYWMTSITVHFLAA